MTTAPIPKEIAMRIGLAARELPDTDAARLLRVLDDAIGLPPTAQKLAKLKVNDLKLACGGEFSDIDHEAIESALACLKGEAVQLHEPPPEVVPYQEGDMPGSIRVACGSNRGELLDGHFGSCRRFLIYQVSRTENRLIEVRHIDDKQARDDKNAYRASLIADCQILFVVSIGGPAAAKVVRTGAHPIKKPQAGSASDEILALQQAISQDAPPWLAKVMGHSPAERIRFEQEAET